MQNYINLNDAIMLIENEELSEKYLNYIVGKKSSQYRHQELKNLSSFLDKLELQRRYSYGFLLGYEVPQLNKEFDLIKFGKEICINIELKGGNVPLSKVKRQLVQNKHYLDLTLKYTMLFTYFSNSNKIYFLNEGELEETNFETLRKILSFDDFETPDLDMVFSPREILISPLNNPDKFIDGKYLLTENQDYIKNDIYTKVEGKKSTSFTISGNAGTGKTLLIFDLARSLSKKYKVLVIHGGILSQGHKILQERLENLSIISAKDWDKAKIKKFDIIILDESHRIYDTTIKSVLDYSDNNNSKIIFAYDEKQKLSNSEINSDTLKIIAEISSSNEYKLTNRIRTNKEISLFITCLFDLSKYRPEYTFDNVEVKYIPDKMEAFLYGNKLEQDFGYTFIRYTPSQYSGDLNYQDGTNNTHRVIGQEFDKVCMVLDDTFFYSKQLLVSKKHPNPNFIFHKLLFQGLTRVRTKLFLIIRDKVMLENVLYLLEK